MPVTRRHYTVAEVEAIIPALERIFIRILQLRVGLRAVEQKLERAGIGIDVDQTTSRSDDPDDDLDDDDHDTDDQLARSSDAQETPPVRQARAVFRGFYEALSDGLENIRALGGDVKDLDLGLVDFPGRRNSDDILFCWRLGEKRIEYWHTLDGGFAGRRPLDESIPRTPTRLD
jgi:hypothetical protein